MPPNGPPRPAGARDTPPADAPPGAPPPARRAAWRRLLRQLQFWLLVLVILLAMWLVVTSDVGLPRDSGRPATR